MEIDINNYESVLIDYFDGNLNALEVAEVLLFLEQHPEIKNEFEAFGTLPVAENITIDHDFKANLKKLKDNKTLAESSFNELIIAQIEGDCSEEESVIIDEVLAGNKSLIKLKQVFQFTKLIPDLHLKFPNKQSLKRREALVFYLNKRFAAAAALLLLASLLFLIYRNTNSHIDHVEIASTKNNTTVTPKAKEEVHEIVLPKEKNITQLATVTRPNQIPRKVFKRNEADKQVAFTKVFFENRSVLPVKSITRLENTLALNSASLAGDVIPVEMVATSAPTNENEFLTIGSFVKKKLIERGKNNLKENEKPVNTDELAIDPITVASVGAGILEKTTGKKVFLSRSFDKSGSVKSYTFAAGDFKFERIK